MRRFSIFIILFLLFILEGTVFQILAPDQYGVFYTFVPRWLFMVIIFVGIYRGRISGIFYGVMFGFMYDVIFGSVLGLYAFGMGFIAYLLSISIPFFQKNLPITVLTSIVAAIALEYYIYGMMLLLNLAHTAHEIFLHDLFIPSMIMNFAVIVVFAYPLKRWLSYLNRKQSEAEAI